MAKGKRQRKGQPVSFRLEDDVAFKLKVLADMESRSQANYLEVKIRQLFEEEEKLGSSAFKRAQSEIKRSKP